jgi:hypothetical protein
MWLDSEAAVRDSGVAWTILRPSGYQSEALRWLPPAPPGATWCERPGPTWRSAAIDPADIAVAAALPWPSSSGSAVCGCLDLGHLAVDAGSQSPAEPAPAVGRMRASPTAPGRLSQRTRSESRLAPTATIGTVQGDSRGRGVRHRKAAESDKGTVSAQRRCRTGKRAGAHAREGAGTRDALSPSRDHAGCSTPVRSPATNVWTSKTVRLMLSSDRPASL